MKNFMKPNEKFPPVLCHVFDDADQTDALAVKRGYYPVEQHNDDQFQTVGFNGFQNSHLHSGWVATMDDSTIKALDQCETLKAKIIECQKRNETVIIGFYRTGHFSVGYSIYVKK